MTAWCNLPQGQHSAGQVLAWMKKKSSTTKRSRGGPAAPGEAEFMKGRKPRSSEGVPGCLPLPPWKNESQNKRQTQGLSICVFDKTPLDMYAQIFSTF